MPGRFGPAVPSEDHQLAAFGAIGAAADDGVFGWDASIASRRSTRECRDRRPNLPYRYVLMALHLASLRTTTVSRGVVRASI